MTNPIIIATPTDDHGKKYMSYWWWCPGCADFNGHGAHRIDDRWPEPIGLPDKPTINGSYLSYGHEPTDDSVPGYKGSPQCHSFIKEGHIQYLDDCTHSLVGQTIDMVPVPDWLVH